MFIELSQEETQTILSAAKVLTQNHRTPGTCIAHLRDRFAAIVAAGDEPRVLDAEGKVESSNRLWDYSTENDILNIADQRGKKLTPELLDKIVKNIAHNDQWDERVEDALDGIWSQWELTGEEAVK